MIKSYITRPIEIQAIKWTGYNIEEVWEFTDDGKCHCYSVGNRHDDGKNELCIHTLDSIMYASPGNYIIRGVGGEFYPCKPDIFEQIYTEVTP